MKKLEPFKIYSTHDCDGLSRHHLRPDRNATGYVSSGWAYAYVDDATGILAIVSDWETWSYRWNSSPEALGEPTLTHFLARRLDPDYTGRKLTSEHGRGSGPARSEFDHDATVTAMKDVLWRRRLAAGHEDFRGWRKLDKAAARYLWNSLGDIEDSGSPDLFMERLYDIADHNLIDDDLYEHCQYKPTNSYRILTECILPALWTSCAKTVAARAKRDGHACECCA